MGFLFKSTASRATNRLQRENHILRHLYHSKREYLLIDIRKHAQIHLIGFQYMLKHFSSIFEFIKRCMYRILINFYKECQKLPNKHNISLTELIVFKIDLKNMGTFVKQSSDFFETKYCQEMIGKATKIYILLYIFKHIERVLLAKDSSDLVVQDYLVLPNIFDVPFFINENRVIYEDTHFLPPLYTKDIFMFGISFEKTIKEPEVQKSLMEKYLTEIPSNVELQCVIYFEDYHYLTNLLDHCEKHKVCLDRYWPSLKLAHQYEGAIEKIKTWTERYIFCVDKYKQVKVLYIEYKRLDENCMSPIFKQIKALVQENLTV